MKSIAATLDVWSQIEEIRSFIRQMRRVPDRKLIVEEMGHVLASVWPPGVASV